MPARLPAGMTWGPASVGNSNWEEILPSSNPCSWLSEQKSLDLVEECVGVNVSNGLFLDAFSYQEPLSSTNPRQV